GGNVVHADEGRGAVEAALRTAVGPAWRARSAGVANPYGTGEASARILAIVRSAARTSRVKRFVDLPVRPSDAEGGPE
ncbi:MAG: UDP-N-acetylglucosamine 2-epimerase (hydrolyzing), partial [Dermatophilaceae bacterium]|nr:UDP-N-acetylglucosamine 2-epimerase (hydrolyzing) [Dermatophilaceae bacterium]